MTGTRYGLAVVLVAACHTDSVMGVDADGSAGGGGLSVQWAMQPSSLPGDVGNNITVESALFRVGYLRVIGDAAPNDLRTTAFDITLEWAQDKQPDRLAFNDAPTGVYSKLAVDIDGHISDSSVELNGRVTVNSNRKDFQIRDHLPYVLALDTDKTLQPGGHVGFGLKIDLGQALGSIDWTQVPTHDGHYELDNYNDPMNSDLLEFHGILTSSIQVDGSVSRADN